MHLDDWTTVAAPEGIELELQLAGLGSRFIAGTVDLIIQGIATLLLALATGAPSGGGHINAVAFVIGAFVIWFTYPIVFEVLAAGRTPGKRLSHLRVIRDSGAPVDLAASAIRNLVRLLDGPLLSYLPTVISILATARNQRPGDLAAGTLVIRESPKPPLAKPTGSGASLASDWDVSAITAEELAAVRRFLERRDTLDRTARHELAIRLATGLASKVAGTGSTGGSAERFLETLAEAKSRRR